MFLIETSLKYFFLRGMKKKGIGIAQFDLFIAALTIDKDYTLITLDTDFDKPLESAFRIKIKNIS